MAIEEIKIFILSLRDNGKPFNPVEYTTDEEKRQGGKNYTALFFFIKLDLEYIIIL